MQGVALHFGPAGDVNYGLFAGADRDHNKGETRNGNSFYAMDVIGRGRADWPGFGIIDVAQRAHHGRYRDNFRSNIRRL